jgi:hypothetical protein
MAQFSGAVKLNNLSDYIAPSQACVVNLKGGKLSADDEDAEARARSRFRCQPYALLERCRCAQRRRHHAR